MFPTQRVGTTCVLGLLLRLKSETMPTDLRKLPGNSLPHFKNIFMKTSIEKLAGSKIQLEIELSPEEFNQFINKTTASFGENIEIKGFRKGKADPKLIEKEVGKEKILAKAAELAIKEVYQETISENRIEPINQPEVKILKLAAGNPFSFQIKTEILPEIPLPDYKKIASLFFKNDISVKDQEVKDALFFLQKSRAKFILKLGPCAVGDWVEIDYNSPQVEYNKLISDAFVLGEGKFIPGFEENIEKMSEGETKDFSLPFPENYLQNELRGKIADFKVKVKSIKTVELPEISDQFAQGLGNSKNLDQLKQNIREGLLLEKKTAESQRIRQDILGKISQSAEFEIPQILIKNEQDLLMEILKERIKSDLDLALEDYLTKIKSTEKELYDSFFKEAENRVKSHLLLREIAKKEGITVAKEEIEDKINKNIKYLSPQKTKELDLEKIKDYTKEVIKNEKVLQFLENFSKN